MKVYIADLWACTELLWNEPTCIFVQGVTQVNRLYCNEESELDWELMVRNFLHQNVDRKKIQ